MKVLSLFDGMSCGLVALKNLGIPVTEYHAFEIDPHAIKVSKANHPEIIHHGDIRNSNFEEFKDFDILLAGFSCQSFSFAGKQLGFSDERGELFFDLMRAKDVVKPKYFLFENVVMKKEFEEAINGYVGVEPFMINSSLFSAQNRKRLYWTNIPFDKDIVDKGITWKDIRDRGVNSDSYYYTNAGISYLARQTRRIKRGISTYNEEEVKFPCLTASHCKGPSAQRLFGIIDYPTDEQAVGAMRGRYIQDGKRMDGKGKAEQQVEFRYDGKTNCLTTVCKDNVVVPFTLPNRIPLDMFFFRYLTPEECERLQTLPTGYTSCVSKTQRYKMLGNGWTVDVIAHILNGLKG